MRPGCAGAGWLALVFALSATLFPGASQANSTARDPVNGSTLLFPYFEVDLDDPAGSNTVVSIRDASATAALGQVTVWSDVGIPVLSFPIYFTGYDVVNFDLREMIVNGSLPVTASAGQDPTDTISNHGPYSQDINFASCSGGRLPYINPVLFAETVEHLQTSLTGQPSPLLSGQCAGFDHGDRIARGYLTVDTVNQCSSSNPSELGYFVSGGGGIATLQNVFSGEYLLRDNAGERLHTGLAVALEASYTNHNTPGNYTFYGRFTNFTAADNREPLNGSWAFDTQGAAADLIVWRDTKAAASTGFNCGLGVPNPLPLGQTGGVHFDTTTQDSAITNPAVLPLATQKVRLGEGDLGGPGGKAGWTFLNLNTTIAGNANPPVDPSSTQAYIEVLPSPEVPGQSAGSAAAMSLDTGNAPSTSPTP